MISPTVAFIASLLLGSRLVASSSARGVDASPDPTPLTVSRDGTTFTIARYIHGRSGVSFRDDTQELCEIIYNKAGHFATIVAGNEEYKVMYDDFGDVVDVERRDEGAVGPASRGLKTGEEYDVDGAPLDIGVDLRYEAVMCEACGEGCDTVCGVGLSSFCDLRGDFGAVFGPMARSAAKTMCGTFARACGEMSRDDVCVARCDGDDDSEGISGGGDGFNREGKDKDEYVNEHDDGDGGDDGENGDNDDDDDDGDSGVDANRVPKPVMVTLEATNFTIARYIHGRSGVSFRDDTDASCEIIYNKDGSFATIVAGSEEYKVMYDENGTVVDVERRDEGSRRTRQLKDEEENYVDGVPQDIGVSRRYEAWTCEACQDGWETVCGVGLSSFCGLRGDYGTVFGILARSAVKTMCGTFVRVCGGISEVDVCVGRCDGGDDDDDGGGNGGSGSSDVDSGGSGGDDDVDDSDDGVDTTTGSYGDDGDDGDAGEMDDDHDDDDGGGDDNGDDDNDDGGGGDVDDDGDDGNVGDDGGYSDSDDVAGDDDGDDYVGSDADDDDGGYDDDDYYSEGDDGSACPGCGTNTTCDGVTCSCLDGFQGDALVACSDPCNPNPCLNGGYCYVDPGGGHICSCARGYGGMACSTETSGLLGFYIELEFLGNASDWTDQRIATFTKAANRWEKVVINQRCPLGTSYFPGRLLISATLEYIDGPDSTLAEAGPTRSWTICPMSSTAGIMRFDTADVEMLEISGNFDTVVTHEMGHTIGIGTLWGDCSTCYTDLDPNWKCPGVVAAYNDLLGNPGGTAANVVEISGRTGTTCGHFSEWIFGDELSSGMINTNMWNVSAPLSKITAASLDDAGYVVDATGVDDYTLPSRRSATAAVVATNDDGPGYVMRRVAVPSTVELVGDDGDVVGETSGIQIKVYGGAKTIT